jgi:hypothetical protein
MVFKELVIAQEDCFSRHAVSLAATLSPASSALSFSHHTVLGLC